MSDRHFGHFPVLPLRFSGTFSFSPQPRHLTLTVRRVLVNEFAAAT